MLSGLSLGMTGAPGSAVVAGRLRQGERPCDKWVEGSIVEVWGMIQISRLCFSLIGGDVCLPIKEYFWWKIRKRFGVTPPKTNMELEITPLEKEKHLQTTNFWVPC